MTYTALAGGQLNWATLEIRIAKFLVNLSHEGSPSNCLAVWCRRTRSWAHPCLSARVDAFKTVRGVYVSCNIQHLDTLQLLLKVRNEYSVCIFMESTNACWQTVYSNGTIHDFAVESQMWLWLTRLLKIPQQIRLRAWQMKLAKVSDGRRKGLYLMCKEFGQVTKSPSRFCTDTYNWPQSATLLCSVSICFPCFDVVLY